MDFAQVRFPWGKRFAFIVVLGHSRLIWLRFYSKQDMRTLFSGLEQAFNFFGGVPRELLFDQMASVITADLRGQGGRLVENAEFLRFAAHWGFRVRACRPYRAQTKGKVERPIRYLRGNFLYRREFLGDPDLDAQTETWLERTANVRIHATTREKPIDRSRPGRDVPASVIGAEAISFADPSPGRVGAPCRPDDPESRGRAPAAPLLCSDHGRCGMRTIRDQIRAQLADLKMPGSLEGLDAVLSQVDSGLGAAEAISAVHGSQITLRNNRRL